MVVVTLSETYDMSTKPNKMSLLAVHTPNRDILKKSFPGLALNYRFFQFLKCDVNIACASILPADPLQIGTEAGDIAPQDMFNPILYKACTGEGLSTIESRILGLGKGPYPNDETIKGFSAEVQDENTIGLADDFSAYYGLLSNRDGFKIAHPQQGLSMKGLVPLVYERLYNIAQNETLSSDNVHLFGSNEAGDNIQGVVAQSHFFKGRPHRMPKLNCTYITGNDTGAVISGIANVSPGGADGNIVNAQNEIPAVPNCYVAVVILPPAKLSVLYYRCVIRWYVEFSDVRPISDIVNFPSLAKLGAEFYKSNYVFDTKDGKSLGMIDARDADIDKIMEGK